MRGVVLAIVMLVAGCDRLLGLTDVHADGDAGVVDTLSDGTPGDTSDGAVADASDAAIDGQGPVCPAGYTNVNGKQIKLVTTALTWSAAMTACINDRGDATNYTHLVVYTSDVDRGFIGAVTASEFWIGFTDRAVEGSPIWVTTGSNGYPNTGDQPWAMGEPSSNNGDEDCAKQLAADDWDNISCLVTAPAYMCQCDGFAPDPTRY